MHSPCHLHVLGSLSPPRLLLGSGTGVANTHGWQSPAPGGELMSCLDLGGLSRPVASPWQPRPSLQVRIIEVFTTHTAAEVPGDSCRQTKLVVMPQGTVCPGGNRCQLPPVPVPPLPAPSPPPGGHNLGTGTPQQRGDGGSEPLTQSQGDAAQGWVGKSPIKIKSQGID